MNFPIEQRFEHEQALNEHGINLTNPDPKTHDLYIGRLVLGTEPLIETLRGNFEEKNIVSAHGHAVIPYMNRRILASLRAKPTDVIEGILHSVYEHPVNSLGAELGLTEVRDSKSANSLIIPHEISRQKTIDIEIEKTRRVIRSYDGAKHPVVPQIRVVEGLGKERLRTAARLINDSGVRQASLSVPVLCGVPKKAC